MLGLKARASVGNVSNSGFDKTEATILIGEDRDMPTYIWRGAALN